MSKPRQEDMLNFYFSRSLELEELQVKKYDLPKNLVHSSVVKPLFQDFKKTTREHIKDLHEKMNRLALK